MSEVEVEVGRRAAEAWAERGVEAALEFAGPEIESVLVFNWGGKGRRSGSRSRNAGRPG
jgi:hypothetical protein